MRTATVDTDILGYKVPKGATVMCNAHFMTKPQEVKEEVRSKSCRDAEEKRGRGFQMRDLEAFMPERWLVRDETGREVFDGSSLTRLAFSLGPRGCFGMLCNTPLPRSAACLFVRCHFAFNAILRSSIAFFAVLVVPFHLWFGLTPLTPPSGKQLAMQEIRIILVLLVLSFDFQPLPDVLNSPRGQQKVLRMAQQCYVKLRAL